MWRCCLFGPGAIGAVFILRGANGCGARLGGFFRQPCNGVALKQEGFG